MVFKRQPILLCNKVAMAVHETWRNVGNKIRYLRKSSGLTLRQLARGCDLSTNTIGLIERSEVAPNVESLCKIANALGVSPSSLFLEVCQPRVVLLRAEEGSGGKDTAGQAAQTLASASVPSSCFRARQNDDKAQPEALSSQRHSVLCLCSQIELELDGRYYCLNPGDSLAFNSNTFHRLRNSGDSNGIAILILHPML